MIELNNDEERNEIWLSNDIYKQIPLNVMGLKEYKGYKIYNSVLMQNNTAIIGYMYYG